MNIFDLFSRIEKEKAAAQPPLSFLVAGLGNPGAQYEGTRHNAGFAALEALAASLGVKIDRARFHALCAEVRIGEARGLLMKPQTYMNHSGTAIAEAAAFYKLPAEQIVVLCDDIYLAPGRVRIRRHGSAGGHNGLKSIIAALGSEEFPRVRIGVGEKPTPEYDLADWVLGRFPKEDAQALAARLPDVCEAVKLILKGDIEQAMTHYSG